jgi:hypothetical protein
MVSRIMKQGEAIPCLKRLPEQCFGKVLLCMRLLCRAGAYLSNLDCAALRAMTVPEGESAVILFGIFIQLLEDCGAIQLLEDLTL